MIIIWSPGLVIRISMSRKHELLQERDSHYYSSESFSNSKYAGSLCFSGNKCPVRSCRTTARMLAYLPNQRWLFLNLRRTNNLAPTSLDIYSLGASTLGIFPHSVSIITLAASVEYSPVTEYHITTSLSHRLPLPPPLVLTT